MSECTWEFYRVATDGSDYGIHHGYGTEAEAKRYCARVDAQSVLPGWRYRQGGSGGCDLSDIFSTQRP